MEVTIANPAAAMAAGANYFSQMRDAKRQSDLQNLFATQGAGIASGDQNAIAAYASLDPQGAMQAQSSQLSMQSTQQDMAFSAEKMQMLREQAKAQAAEHAARMTAQERAAEAAKTNQIITGAAAMYSQGNKVGYDAFLSAHGLDPAQYPFEQFPAYAAMADGALEALKTFDSMKPEPVDLTKGAPEGMIWRDPTDPRAGVVPIPGMQTGPDWRAATPAEAAQYGATGGQINTKSGEFKPTTGKGLTINNYPPGEQTPKESNAATTGDTIWTAANRARALIGGTSTGLIGQAMGNLPISDAAEVQRQVNVLKSNASVAGIQAMRDASKTGGAVGSPSDKDMAILQDKAGALDPNAGADRFKQQLDDYERTLFRITYGQKNGDIIFAQTRDGTSPLDVQLPDAAAPTDSGAELSPEAKALLEQWQ